MLYHESFPVIGDFCPKPFGQFFLNPKMDIFLVVAYKFMKEKKSKEIN